MYMGPERWFLFILEKKKKKKSNPILHRNYEPKLCIDSRKHEEKESI